MSDRQRHSPVLIWAALFGATVFTSGCRSDPGQEKGPYPVSGKVTYQGKPIPTGLIHFEPDASQGASGPTLTAEIVNGKYTSPQGKGTMGGAQLVQIEAYEPPSGDSNVIDAPGMEKPLFPTYRTTTTLPRQKTVQDFDVPDLPPQPPKKPRKK